MKLELDVQKATDQVVRGLLPNDAEIEHWVCMALQKKYNSAQLTVRIVGYEESRQLNEKFRHRSGPTNVLSFPFERPDMVQPPLLGDIVICGPLVVKEAADQNKEVKAHWAHIVIHGVLHLLGYDHEDADEANIMESLEKKIMTELNYPDPYALSHDQL